MKGKVVLDIHLFFVKCFIHYLSNFMTYRDQTTQEVKVPSRYEDTESQPVRTCLERVRTAARRALTRDLHEHQYQLTFKKRTRETSAAKPILTTSLLSKPTKKTRSSFPSSLEKNPGAQEHLLPNPSSFSRLRGIPIKTTHHH